MLKKIQLSSDLLNKIKEIISKMDLSKKDIKVFIFGSRVQKKANQRSDIDIGMEKINQEKIPAKLKFDFLDYLEKIPTLLSFDIVDFSLVNQDFKKEVYKKIYYLN